MAAKSKTMVGGDDLLLPPEIVEEILTRASVKLILRCRSVCKSWYSLISSRNFISEYRTKNLNKNGSRVLLGLQDRDWLWSFSSHDESFMESRGHDDVLRAYLDSNLEIVGSCNGLICLSSRRLSSTDHTFLIWNPTIRKIVELPSRTFFFRTQMLSYRGFGFDHKANDYKVLRVVANIKNCNITSNVCEILDLRKGVWRVIRPRVPSRGGDISECYLDGAIHWSDSRVLLSFSLSDECFREIKMPGYGESRKITRRTLTFNKLIYVMMNDTGREEYSVWAMREYGVAESWTKMFNIRRHRKDIISFFPRFTYLWKYGEVLTVHAHQREIGGDLCDKRDLVSYNPESEKYKTLFSSVTGRISYFCLYEESLVLL